jgi:hypothetical protein
MMDPLVRKARKEILALLDLLARKAMMVIQGRREIQARLARLAQKAMRVRKVQ